MANFTAAMTFGIENLCAADPSHLMTVPPKLDFDFADFHQKFCAINMTKLSEESMDFSGSGNLTQMVSIYHLVVVDHSRLKNTYMCIH